MFSIANPGYLWCICEAVANKGQTHQPSLREEENVLKRQNFNKNPIKKKMQSSETFSPPKNLLNGYKNLPINSLCFSRSSSQPFKISLRDA